MAGCRFAGSSSNGCGRHSSTKTCIKGYGDGREAKAGIGEWIRFYNETRLHQALGYRTPMAVWRQGAIEIAAGAAKGYGHVDNARALPTATTTAECYCSMKEEKRAAVNSN